MPKIIFCFLLLTFSQYAQTNKFVWITNLNEYSDESIPIEELIDSLNTIENMDMVFISGKLSENGTFEEFENTSKLLNNLESPYCVLPGKNEIRRTGLINFREFWFDLNYSFEIRDIQLIGLTGEFFLNSRDLVFTPETIKWLSETVNPDKSIFIFTNTPDPNNYKNIGKVMESIPDSSFAGFLALADLKNRPIPLLSAKLSEENYDGFNLVLITTTEDTVSIGNYSKKSLFEETTSTIIPAEVDSSIYENKQEDLNDLEIIYRKEFNSTLTAKPVYHEHITYICEKNGLISALDSTGTTIWDFDAFGDIISTPVVTMGKFVAATFQGDLVILDALTGVSIETIGFEDYITSDLLVIEYSGSKELLIRNQEDSKTAIVFGTSSGKVYCYDLETVQEYWVNDEASDYINTQIEFAKDKIIYSSTGGNIYCVDAKRGWLTWRWNERTSKNKTLHEYSLVVHKDKVFAASTSGKVFGISLTLGKTLWQSEKFRSPATGISLSPNKKNLLVKVYNNKLILLSQRTGTNLNVVRYSKGFDEVMGNVFTFDKDMYATSSSGILYKMKNFKKSEIVFDLGDRIPYLLILLMITNFLYQLLMGWYF